MTFIYFLCLLYIYCFSLPPFILRQTPLLPSTTSLPGTTTSSTTLPLPSSFQASRAILFPRYRLPFPYFLALGIVTAAATITILFNCIACFCRPLMYLPLSYDACYNYAYIQQ